jgi:hypothetical protein
MRRQTFALLIGLIALAVGIVLAKFSPARVQTQVQHESTPEAKQVWPVSDYKLSGPYTHENLTVYLIHGEDGLNGKPFLTLQEAMDRKLVVVHETSEVNELAVENLSARDEVFVQAGDIVKGGQQDRVLSVDLIVPARSGRVPIAAFCVEQGRWSRRGGEPAAAFSVSNDMAATKELKMAAKHAKSQSGVWGEVATAQRKLSASTNGDVRSEASASSLQLSLENEKVRESADGYVKKLSAIVEGKPDVIGYVFAVNGRVSSADAYASGELFVKLWPKLLRASAVEAVAELSAYEKTATASMDSIRSFIADAESGRVSEREVTKRTKMIEREGGKVVFFETRDMAQAGAWVHRNYLAK